MKLGILSDTHNNVATLRTALTRFREQGAERLVHCGDVTAPKMFEEFIGWRVNFVFGNGDHRDDLKSNVRVMLPDCTISEQWSEEIDGMRLGAVHGDQEHCLREMIVSGLYDYVFRGHSHLRLDAKMGRTRVINPGSLGGKRPQTRSICVLDLATDHVEFIDIGD